MDPKFRTIFEVRKVLEAAMKYEMVDVIKMTRTALMDFTLSSAHPLQVFAIACFHKWEEDARLAARNTLDRSLKNIYIPELEDISAGPYFRLLQYNKAGKGSDVDSTIKFCFLPRQTFSGSTSKASWKRDMWVDDSPFPFNMPHADAILRTSDQDEFRVHTDILSIASPVFRDMFTRPIRQIGPWKDAKFDRKNGLRVIFITEDSWTLDQLLRFCYPVGNPNLDNLITAKSILDAAKKYEIMAAITPLRERFKEFAQSEPLRVYAIASAQHWELELRQAARLTLRGPIEGLYIPELEDISAGSYHRLLQYHEDCGQIAADLVNRYLEIDTDSPPSGKKSTWFSCRKCPADKQVGGLINASRPRAWWCNYMRRVAAEVQFVPSGETATDPDSLESALAEAAACSTCRPLAFSDLHDFSIRLAAEIESALPVLQSV